MKGKMKNIIYLLIFLPMALIAQDKEKEAKSQEPAKIKLAEKQILRKVLQRNISHPVIFCVLIVNLKLLRNSPKGL